ncbi:MAG TPA: hypothetical protein VJP60_06415 [Rhizomicrobium sp.]|nr:hypothetical protein [Rhizomicrobium sp.]
MTVKSIWVVIAAFLVAGAGLEPGAALPSDAPMTVAQPSPEMIARAREFLMAMGAFKSSDSLAELLNKFYEPRLFAIVKIAPADVAAARNVLQDVTRDILHHRQEATVAKLSSYFSDHFKNQDIDDATAFLASPLGKQMLQPKANDDESRQEVGRYTLQHPQFLQIMTASATVIMKDTGSALSASQETRQAQVLQQFCDRLKNERIAQTGCVN